jgi:ketosteroid isomerase-like protein
MKIRLLLGLAGFAIGFAMPAFAQEKDTVDPEVRQQIEAVRIKFDEAFKKHDAAALAALFTQDAVEVWEGYSGGAAASGQQAIEKRWAIELASSPTSVSKLVQVGAIGNDICTIEEYSTSSMGHNGYVVTIYVRDADTWKISMAYAN